MLVLQVVGKRLAPFITIRIMGLAHAAQVWELLGQARPAWGRCCMFANVRPSTLAPASSPLLCARACRRKWGPPRYGASAAARESG